MTLFSGPTCLDSHRIRFMLAEKGITPEIVDVPADKRSEDLADFNPYGTLPTLVDRDIALYSVGVITEYLDERFPHPPLMPVDPVSRAKARLVLYRIEQDWCKPLLDLEAGGAGTTAIRRQLTDSLTSAADLFAEDEFFLSGDLSVMDCAVAPLLWRLVQNRVRLPAEEAAAIFDYSERIFARESFQLSLTDAERAMRQ
jgi:RNA polymerase-associated protein